MLSCVVTLCCLLLACSGEPNVREYNLSVSHHHNATTRYSQVQVVVDHLYGEHWDIYVSERALRTLAKISRVYPVTKELSGGTIGKQTSLSAKGYKLVPGLGYYKLYKNQTRWIWKDAVEICNKDGSHLLILNSELEAMTIMSMIVRSSEASLGHWVGIHDEYKKGDYVTIFNETLKSTGYPEWFTGYPSRQTNSCLWFFNNLTIKSYGHVDGDCNSKQPFFCEFEVL